jgi:hypothetical protein
MKCIQAKLIRGWLILIIVLWSSSQFAQMVKAQTTVGWSPPVDISPGIATTPPQGWGPVIAADQKGRVYAAWAECSSDENLCKSDTIYYSVLNEGSWSMPVDVLAAPVGEALVTQSLSVDPYGRLVLVWMGNRGLNVSIAAAADADTPQAWATTTLASSDAVRTSDMFIDDKGMFHLVYIANDREIRYSTSTDGGDTWANPVIIYNEERSDAATIAPKIAVDRANSVYVCWTATSEVASWSAVGIQFAKSRDSGATWTPPQWLHEGLGYGSCALLTDKEERLHAFWLGSISVGGRYHRWSTDGGASWTDTVTVAAPGEINGFTGAPVLLEDSQGILHAVFGGRDSSSEKIWHARWDGRSWTRPESIAASLPHSEKSAATLSQGKYLHVIWLEYQSLDIWHSFADTGAPLTQTEILAVPTVSVTSLQASSTPAPSEQASPTEEPVKPDLPVSTKASPTTFDSSTLFVISVVPVVLLVGGVIVYRVARRK